MVIIFCLLCYITELKSPRSQALTVNPLTEPQTHAIITVVNRPRTLDRLLAAFRRRATPTRSGQRSEVRGQSEGRVVA